MKTPKKLTIISRFDKNDENCSGDYCEVKLLIDEKLAITYGDYYHDKGSEKIEGFIDGLKWVFSKKFQVIEVTKNDYNK